MYKAAEINNNATDFKVGDTVRFYSPVPGTLQWGTMKANYFVGTGVITKTYVSKETEAGHFGHGIVKGATYGETVFEVETENTMLLRMSEEKAMDYRPWKQTRKIVMGMPFGGLAKA